MSDPTPSPTPVAATEPVIDAAAIATATAEAEAEAAAAAAEYQANTNLLVACTQGKLEDIKVLVEAKADVCFQDKDSGLSPLMVASQAGNIEIVKYILGRGAPWNALDINGMCAGDYAGNAMASGDDDAAKAKQLDCYEELVNAGCRAELVLGMMKRVKAHMAKPPAKRGRDGDSKGDEKEASNADYLQQKLKYSEGKLLDANDDAVMMGWEGPLMEQHAALICAKGGDVLNVGFGLGLIDMAIQKHNPKNHHIIEAHPDVYQHMLDQGWDKKDNVTIHFGRWQDVIPTLPQFDGIFFDTYGEFYEDLRVFHEEVPCLLKPGGIYSFFNGLGASTNAFFHTVYCRLVDMELKQFGIKTEYVAVDIDPSDTKIWAGVTRKYWVLTQYNLPICLMEPKDGEMETLAKVVMDAEVTGAAESQDSKEKAEE